MVNHSAMHVLLFSQAVLNISLLFIVMSISGLTSNNHFVLYYKRVVFQIPPFLRYLSILKSFFISAEISSGFITNNHLATSK
jgi:hypothetical protein